MLGTLSPAAEWPTFGGSAARTNFLADDRSFSTQNVTTLRRRWVATLERPADSTPIVLTRVAGVPGDRPLLVQTDGGGTTYGIDGSNGEIRWRFKTTGPKITSSTSVADPSEKTVYVPGVDGRIHKLVAATGAELHEDGFPVTITRLPDIEKDASPLNLAGGYLYAVTSGYFGDAGPYVGHVVAIRLRDGTAHVLNSQCADRHALLDAEGCSHVRSGIWARVGAVIDPDPGERGRVYVATGNGAFDADRGGHDYGDSVLALALDASLLEQYFTPANFAELEDSDEDLGSTAPAMLPRDARSRTPLMAAQGGKGGTLYLLDRRHLGGVAGALQALALPDELFTAPAVWRDGTGQTWIALGFLPGGTGITAYKLVTDANGRSRLERAWTSAAQGTSPVASNGVVFAAASGAVSALDARTGRVLWTSTAADAGGTIGDVHWQSPVAVNGWLYCSDQAGHLTAYALASGNSKAPRPHSSR